MPEINPEDEEPPRHHFQPQLLHDYHRHGGECPERAVPIRTMTASTHQAVSGAGAGGPIELMNEVEALSKGETMSRRCSPIRLPST